MTWAEWLLVGLGILFVAVGLLILVDVHEERRRRRVHESLDRYGRKRVGL